jgi:recombinational DNA repair protein (RecF pathway)
MIDMITTIKCPECGHHRQVDDWWQRRTGDSICGKCRECWYETPNTDVDDVVPCPDFLVETWKLSADFDKALEALKQAERHLLEAHAGLPALLLSQIINELDEVEP